MSKTYVSELSEKIDHEVVLKGWVANRRDLGKLIFLDLRDSTGIVQIVADESAGEVRHEDVVEVQGMVKSRNLREGDGSNLPVEIKASSVTVLSHAETPPFPLNTDGREIDDTLRSQYRYLDLRRPRLQENILFRDKFLVNVRQFFHENDFAEIETPLLTKTTPEGSRDFVVPSRTKKGMYYALPQSPQQYKQLLMLAGFERYFQIARCLRDEDLRADRSYEHSQIDVEMSFVERNDVMNLIEEMITQVVKKLGYVVKEEPFPRFTYEEAKQKFGSDKFDLRNQEDKEKGVLAFSWVTDFPLFEKTTSGGWTFSHNPFSDPLPEHKERLMNGEIESVISTQYDLVCNGYEVGGGSIRSSDPAILRQVLKTIGHTEDEIEEEFGHMLKALTYGAPPHGGLAMGVERMVAILRGEENIREVQAFPMTYSGQTSVMDAPSSLSRQRLEELGLK